MFAQRRRKKSVCSHVQFETNKPMIRRAIGVLTGILIIQALWRLAYISGFIPVGTHLEIPLWKTLTVMFLPFLIAGIATGYIAKRNGLILGFLVAFLHLGYWTIYWLAFIGPIAFAKAHDMTVVLYDVGKLLSGTFGGLFGQLLAQKLHKKSAC